MCEKGSCSYAAQAQTTAYMGEQSFGGRKRLREGERERWEAVPAPLKEPGDDEDGATSSRGERSKTPLCSSD